MFKIRSRFYVIYGDNVPIYVGYTNRTVKQRFAEHKRSKDFSDYDTVEVKELKDQELSFDFTWDLNVINGNADIVSKREMSLIQQFNTQNSCFQKAFGGGQNWNDIKHFVSFNKDNPKFKGMSASEIKKYLNRQKKMMVMFGNFIGKIHRSFEDGLRNFVGEIRRSFENNLNCFVGHIKRSFEEDLNCFVGVINRPFKDDLKHFIGHIHRPFENNLNCFIKNIHRPFEGDLSNFVNNIHRPFEINLSSFVGGIKRPFEEDLYSFINHIERPFATNLHNFIVCIERPFTTNLYSFINRVERPFATNLHSFVDHIDAQREN